MDNFILCLLGKVHEAQETWVAKDKLRLVKWIKFSTYKCSITSICASNLHLEVASDVLALFTVDPAMYYCTLQLIFVVAVILWIAE